MKKVSTAAANEISNFSRRKLTIGLDLGDRSSWYCVLDESGLVRVENRVSTTPKAVREVFGGMPSSRIALETGMAQLRLFGIEREVDNQVAAPAETRTPNINQSADGRMATVATRRRKTLDSDRPSHGRR